MLNSLLVGGGAATLSGIVGFLISKKISLSNFGHHEAQARAKANAIESEAQNLLIRATSRSNEIEKEAIRKYDEVYTRAKNDLTAQEAHVLQLQNDFENFRLSESSVMNTQRSAIENMRLNLERNERALEKLKEEYHQKMGQVTSVLESIERPSNTEVTCPIF